MKEREMEDRAVVDLMDSFKRLAVVQGALLRSDIKDRLILADEVLYVMDYQIERMGIDV